MNLSINNKNEKKTIIFSANTSWYLKNFRENTLSRFIDQGFKVICIAPKDSSSDDLISLGCKFIPLNINNKGLNPFQDMKLIYTLYKLYKLHKPHAVFNFTIKNNIYGSYASALSGIKIFNHITGLGTTIIHGGVLSLFVKILYLTSQFFATKVFCQNSDDYQFFKNNFLVSKKKLQILPGSGVNLNKFSHDTEVSISAKDENNPIIFLYAGRLLKDKGLIELVEALKIINSRSIQCKLQIYGFIDNKNISSISEPEVMLWKNIPGIEWCGATKDIINVMKNIDCVILPSYREGMPRTLLEAAALSIPLIATDVPGCREIVQHNINGILCKPRSVSSLKKSILKMKNLSINERKKMGTAGRRLIEKKFDEEIVIKIALDAAS